MRGLGFDGWFLPPLSLAERLGRGVGSGLVLVGDVLADDGKRGSLASPLIF